MCGILLLGLSFCVVLWAFIPREQGRDQVGSEHEEAWEWMWNAVRYRYYGENTDMAVWNSSLKDRIATKIKKGMSQRSFDLLMDATIADLDDEHTYYQSSAEANDSLDGEKDTYYGIGCDSVLDGKTGEACIASLVAQGPGEKSGLRVGDTITSINGKPPRFFLRESNHATDPRPMRLGIRTKENTIKTLTVEPALLPNSCLDGRLLPAFGDSESRIAYVEIKSFDYKRLDERFDALRATLVAEASIAAFIVDLRGNAGGMIEQACSVAGFFYDGPIGQMRNRNGEVEETLVAEGKGSSIPRSIPLLILVGPQTASAAEIFAYGLQGVGRAQLVGGESAKLLTNSEALVLPNDAVLWLATKKFFPLHQGKGTRVSEYKIDTVVPCKGNGAPADRERDPVLEAAIRLLER